jgi:hypothetical protein
MAAMARLITTRTAACGMSIAPNATYAATSERRMASRLPFHPPPFHAAPATARAYRTTRMSLLTAGKRSPTPVTRITRSAAIAYRNTRFLASVVMTVGLVLKRNVR